MGYLIMLASVLLLYAALDRKTLSVIWLSGALFATGWSFERIYGITEEMNIISPSGIIALSLALFTTLSMYYVSWLGIMLLLKLIDKWLKNKIMN